MKYFCNFECGIILHEKADVQSFISLVLNTHKFEYHDEEFITHSLLFSHTETRPLPSNATMMSRCCSTARKKPWWRRTEPWPMP